MTILRYVPNVAICESPARGPGRIPQAGLSYDVQACWLGRRQAGCRHRHPKVAILISRKCPEELQSKGFKRRKGEVARRADVRHNAPYKHFADKRELLEAVSAAGFEMLTTRMANEIASCRSPREQLFALLRAYVMALKTRRSTA